MVVRVTTKIRINAGWQKQALEEALDVMPALMDQVVAVSKSRSPVQFKVNKESLSWKAESRRKFMAFTESGYGGWLHVGTRRMQGRPYIVNGVLWLQNRLKTVKNKEELNRPLGDPGRPMRIGDRPLAKAV